MKPEQKEALCQWYGKNKRPLPWRTSKDPYAIWISESMLQQTTIQVVLPYYERFLDLFPSLEDLARAPQGEVLAAWAGLGYYSRARLLHQAAQKIKELGKFPKSHQELLSLPGFGPYTARAVSSIAYGEKVGVVDGNVIRVLSRFFASNLEWWKPKVRQQFQSWADALVADHPPGDMNQALMDLGSTLCTRHQPACRLCPLQNACLAFKRETQLSFPRKKVRRPREIWYWKPEVCIDRNQVNMVYNENLLPFLKNQWILPGKVQRLAEKPTSYSFRHSITHHDIFVQPITKQSPDRKPNQKAHWISLHQLSQHMPASLIKKALLSSDQDSMNRPFKKALNSRQVP